eukprot:961344-Lingulodinium_polyedra.AAC.1
MVVAPPRGNEGPDGVVAPVNYQGEALRHGPCDDRGAPRGHPHQDGLLAPSGSNIARHRLAGPDNGLKPSSQ